MPSAWQSSPPAHQAQPLSFSLQLQPATDTDGGSIAAIPPDSASRPIFAITAVPAAAAQREDEACSSHPVASASNSSMRLSQLHNGQKGMPDGLHERQSRLSNRHSSRQHASTSRSDCMGLEWEDCKSLKVGSQGIELDQRMHGSVNARLSVPSHGQVQHMQPAEADRAESSQPAVQVRSAHV